MVLEWANSNSIKSKRISSAKKQQHCLTRSSLTTELWFRSVKRTCSIYWIVTRTCYLSHTITPRRRLTTRAFSLPTHSQSDLFTLLLCSILRHCLRPSTLWTCKKSSLPAMWSLLARLALEFPFHRCPLLRRLRRPPRLSSKWLKSRVISIRSRRVRSLRLLARSNLRTSSSGILHENARSYATWTWRSSRINQLRSWVTREPGNRHLLACYSDSTMVTEAKCWLTTSILKIGTLKRYVAKCQLCSRSQTCSTATFVTTYCTVI